MKSNCQQPMARLVYNNKAITYFPCCILCRSSERKLLSLQINQELTKTNIVVCSIISCQRMPTENDEIHV